MPRTPLRLYLLCLALLLAGCAVRPLTPLAPHETSAPAGEAVSAGSTGTVPARGQAAAGPAQFTPTAATTGALADTPAAAPTGETPVLPATPAATATAEPPTAVVVNVVVALVAQPTQAPTQAPVQVLVAPPTLAPPATAPPTAAPPTAAPPTALSVAPPPSADVAAAEQYCIDLVNARRAENGLPPLAREEALMGIARARVADMVARGYTGHNDPVTGEALGRSLVLAAGYRWAGENWYGSVSGPVAIVERAMAWFMTDPAHYRNILSPTFDAVGIGIAYNGRQWLLVQNFAGY